MQFFGIADPFIWTFEFIDLLDELGLGLDVGEHLLPAEHFVEDESCAPDIALLVVLFEFEYLGGCVERSAGTFGHLYLEVSCEAEVSDLKFFVFIEEDIIGFKVPM